MVNFNPSIDYSNEAGEVFGKFREYKREKEKTTKDKEILGYVTIDWSCFSDKIVEDANLFFKENKEELIKNEMLTQQECNNLSRRTTVFFTKTLIDWLKLNLERKIKVLFYYKGFAFVELHSKRYIVPENLLIPVQQESSEGTGKELALKENNQLTLKTDLSQAVELLEKVSEFDDKAFEGQLAEIENLKAQMEAKITAMYEMQAKMMSELQEKVARYKHELLMMRTDLTAFEYRHGLTIDFTRITKGNFAPVEQPIVVYQKLIYLDEDLPRFQNLYDVNAGSLEVALKHSPSLLEHICPTNKGVTFLKMRNASGTFELENTVMKFIADTMPNEIGILIRNGENTWITWLDSDNVSFSQDSFASISSQEEEPSLKLVQSRYYVFSIILGLIERGELLQLNHIPTDIFSDTGIILSNADSQITDSTYIELSDLMQTLNKYSKADDPIFVLNSFTDRAKYYGRYGGGTTQRGRGDNALTDDTSVERGINKIRGIDYFSDFTTRYYVRGEKSSWKYDDGISKISPSLYIENDEFLNIKFLTSTLVDYYIHTKRIGQISNSGRYVTYTHMLPILFEIKKELEKQEKEDRLHIVAKDYDLNLLTSFKIIHDVRIVTEYQAKRYSKWLCSLSEEEKQYFGKLLIINDLDKYIRYPKAYTALSEPVILEKTDDYKGGCDIFSIGEYAQPHLTTIKDKKKEFEYYEQSVLDRWGSSKIKVFGSKKSVEKVISSKGIYQEYHSRKRASGIDIYHFDFGERKWHIVDFYDTENNRKKVEIAEEMNEKMRK